MFNLNSIPIPENNPNDNMNMVNDDNKNFPTVGLKSILQNSDLLELLLKPMESPDQVEKEKINNNIQVDSVNFNNNNPNESDLSTLNLDDLLKPTSKIQIDHDYFECNEAKMDRNLTSSPSKSYGNAFLGPSLWDKDDIFQGEKFGVEYLGIDEFLNDNNLNEADIKFLDRLQSNDSIVEDTTHIQTSSPNSTIHDPKENILEPILKVAPIMNNPNVTVKVKDDSKIVQLIQPNKSISNMIAQWKEDDEDTAMSLDEDVTTKRFFDDRLTLQPTLKKSKKQFVPNELKDEKYWARRKKNNVAAKRSRDTRRFKENQIVIAATYLEHENDQLRKQLLEAKEKMAQMQARLDKYERAKSN